MRIIATGNTHFVIHGNDDSPLLHFGNVGERLTNDERYDLILAWCNSTQTAELAKHIPHDRFGLWEKEKL